MNRSLLALMSTFAVVAVSDRDREPNGIRTLSLGSKPDPLPQRQERRTEVIIGSMRTRLTDAECRTLGVDPDDRCIGQMLAKCACGAQLDSADERWQGSRKARLLAAGWGDGSACPKCRAKDGR